MAADLRARLLAKAVALLVMCAGCFFGHAHAASLVWTERTNGDLTTLAYGPLDPDEIPLLLLSCFNEMEIAVLDVHQAVEGSAGDAITIELSSAKGQAPIEGEIAKNRETGTTFAEAKRHQGEADSGSLARRRVVDTHHGQGERHTLRRRPSRGRRAVRQGLQAELN